MAPDVPTVWLNPSYWLYRLIPKIRVSSRAGIMVHFSMLMIVGFLLSQKVKKWKWQKYFLYPGALLAIFALDYFPLQTMPMAQVMPAYDVLKRENGPCEVGMAFPYINAQVTALDTYIMFQRMRGTDCKVLNEIKRKNQLQFMTNKFPPDMNFVKNLPQNDNAAEELEKLARCMPLNWILFLEPIPPAWAQNVCDRLGWKLFPDKICSAPVRNKPMQKLPTDCL